MKRSYLFLQGPHGPFFQILGRHLMAENHHVVRVNFNGGDVLNWSGPETIAFREEAAVWPEFVAQIMKQRDTTDLVLFGDCRPLHRVALRTARDMGIRCHVFEEGYIRPHWITLETGGVNGNSSLPVDANWYLEQAKRLPDKTPFKPTGNSTRAMMCRCSTYYTARLALQAFFPHFRSHRPYTPWAEIRYWALKLLRKRAQARRDKRFQFSFLDSGPPFFLFCLQLGSDYQIRQHSPFKTMKAGIVKVLRSFANNLPDDICLLVKNHPLAIGLENLDLFTMDLADHLGIRDRVFFTQGGNLPAYIKASEGVVVVNSTAGISALHHRRPTIALGKAIYNIPGLTHRNGLKSFWSSPTPPNYKLYSAFYRVVLHETQINGSFYTNKGIAIALPEVVNRLEVCEADRSQFRTNAVVSAITVGGRGENDGMPSSSLNFKSKIEHAQG